MLLTLSLLSASFLRKSNESFFLENVSNLTHEFFYDNFNKKTLVSFLVKIVKQKIVSNGTFFSFPKEASKRENFNIFKYIFYEHL